MFKQGDRLIIGCQSSCKVYDKFFVYDVFNVRNMDITVKNAKT